MVLIVFDILLEFGVPLGLLVSLGIIGAAVGKFHESLKGDTDPFAPVMAGDAGFMGYPRIDLAVDRHFCFAR